MSKKRRAIIASAIVLILSISGFVVYFFVIGRPIAPVLDLDREKVTQMEVRYVYDREVVFDDPEALEKVRDYLLDFRYTSVLPLPSMSGWTYSLSVDLRDEIRGRWYKLAPNGIEVENTWYLSREDYFLELIELVHPQVGQQ